MYYTAFIRNWFAKLALKLNTNKTEYNYNNILSQYNILKNIKKNFEIFNHFIPWVPYTNIVNHLFIEIFKKFYILILQREL